LSATFDIANKKADEAKFTSDLSSNAEACTDIESQGKRVPKRPVAYSPPHAHSAKKKEKSAAELRSDAFEVPAVPSELAELSIENMVNENMQLVEPEHETSPVVSRHLSQTEVSVENARDAGQPYVNNSTSSKDNSFACGEVNSLSNQNVSQNLHLRDSHDNASTSRHRMNMSFSVEGRDNGMNDRESATRASLGQQSTVSKFY